MTEKFASSMTHVCSPTPLRRKIGSWLVAFSILLSLGIAYRLHREEVRSRQTDSHLASRQEIIYGIIYSSVFPMVVMGENREIIEWNDAMVKLTGKTKFQIQKEGLEIIICDEKKAEKHCVGLEKAFSDTAAKETNDDKVIMVYCSVWDAEHKPVPVRIAIRMIKAQPSGSVYAIARIDRESKIIEYGIPSPQKTKVPY